MRKLKGLKPTIIKPKLLEWGKCATYVIRQYSIVVNTISNTITVYYDINNVGPIFIYHKQDEGMLRVRVDNSNFNRTLPKYMTDLIDELLTKLICNEIEEIKERIPSRNLLMFN